MDRLPRPLSLGDLRDVEAYVRTIVAKLPLGERDEFEEYVADGLELVARKHAELHPGQSLQHALGGWLLRRLQDRWRERHGEWRRNARAATAYALPAPTGLAWEHPQEGRERFELAGRDEQRLIESRLRLELFQSERDLGDPRKVGRFRGVPSWGAVATGTRREIWAAIQAERELASDTVASQPPPFGFLR